MYKKLVLRVVLFIVLCVAVLSGSLWAETKTIYSDDMYKSLVDASSPDTIPPGTVITTQNWQKYKNFMPIGLQLLYGGQYRQKIESGPDWAVPIGPTRPVPLPKQYILDTEKYHNQVQLAPTSIGSFNLKGYVAGIPFPNPTEPDLAAKVMYNGWLAFYPFVYHYISASLEVDPTNSVYYKETMINVYHLSHLSEPGMPLTLPYAAGVMYSNNYLVVSPEQAKYTGQLSMLYDDPAKPQELFLFLPSLRRVLRSSSAARCAPTLGGDSVTDDLQNSFGFLPVNFKPVFLGEKKIIAMTHAVDDASTHYQQYFHVTTSTIFSKPEAGKWEVRDVYVIDIRPIPEAAGAGYCYGHKVIYVDKDTNLADAFEVYDEGGKFWKVFLDYYPMVPISPTESTAIRGVFFYSIMDLQNDHASVSATLNPSVDQYVPAEWRKGNLYAFPASLTRIMR
jgi:hypothetical protein